MIVLGSISSGTEEMLSHARSSEVTALEGVGKVTRTELFRFEAYDITNVQWVIRTWNGGHLAIDGDGYLMVKVYTCTGTLSCVCLCVKILCIHL